MTNKRNRKKQNKIKLQREEIEKAEAWLSKNMEADL